MNIESGLAGGFVSVVSNVVDFEEEDEE